MKNMFKVIGIIVMVMIIGVSFTACDDGSGKDKDTVPAALQGTWESVDVDAQVVYTGTTFTFTEYEPAGSITGSILSVGTITKEAYLETEVLSRLEEEAPALAQLGITEDDFDDIVDAILNDTLNDFIETLGLTDESVLDSFLDAFDALDDLQSYLDRVSTFYRYNGKVTAVTGYLTNYLSIGDPISSDEYGTVALYVDGTLESFGYLFEKQ